MKSFTALLAATLLCLMATGARAQTVTIDAGTLSGARDGTVDVYKDIPYAAPPVGPMRWQPPALPAHWQGARDATRFGTICPQPSRPDGQLAMGGDLPQSEDCLFLNVWTPAGAKKA